MIIAVYVWDSINIKSEIKQIKSNLSIMDIQLRSGTGIMDEVSNIRQHFTKKKNIYVTFHFSIFTINIPLHNWTIRLYRLYDKKLTQAKNEKSKKVNNIRPV